MRASDSYVMTAHTASAGDMLELETVRKTIKSINKMAKENDRINQYRFDNGWSSTIPSKSPRYRVKCQGRGPRTEFAIASGRNPRAFDQSLPLKFAERMDVYVYQI
tara:strand:- start:749 stop:1066 length:318 start_codon:yes stop_codon:yes gene_type:complete